MPTKLNLSDVPKLKPNPIFKGLSKELKDPKNFAKIEKKLQDALYSDHKHKAISSYAKCERCQVKRMKRQKLMTEMGFKGINQYLEWKKIMSIIINKQNFQIR